MKSPRSLPALALMCFTAAIGQPGSASARPAPASDANIDALIEHLVAIIKDRQQLVAAIHISGPVRVMSTGETVTVGKSYHGSVISRDARRILFETVDGERIEVAPQHVDRLDAAGHFRGERTEYHSHGGRTALATLALVSAGLGRHDPVVSRALDYLEHHPMPGTYGRALRASLYSHLLQHAPSHDQQEILFKCLRRDARWLVLAMNEAHGYTYTSYVDAPDHPGRLTLSDNSNSQFGNLGVWISALAGYRVSKTYWQNVEDFWLGQQNADGGWGYKRSSRSTQNMTIAGINSLIIVLDQHYARAGGRYRLLKGIRKQARMQSDVARLRAALGRAIQWLAVHGQPHGEAYTQLGHERLGLASGYKYFGPHDWYAAGARRAMDLRNWEHKRIEDVSMWLLFLAFGRAPVLVNKLQWGGPESGWDYYYRDMYHACRFLSNTYEQIYKWQIIDTGATLVDLIDAPLLYIGGEQPFSLPPDTAARVRRYVLGGGTVIGHANLNSRPFTDSFERFFEEMFADWGTEFRQLPSAHALHAADASGRPLHTRVPVRALSDGFREAVILLPVDIAGAWHQSLTDKHPDLFTLFANLRFYSAPAYRALPGRLRVAPPAVSATTPRGRLRVLRARTRADRGGAPAVWETMNQLMTRHYGVTLEIVPRLPLSSIDSRRHDIVHVCGQGAHTFAVEEVAAMRAFCRSGGLLLIEALGGDRVFADAVMPQLGAILGSPPTPLQPDDPLIAGRFADGKPLGGLACTRAARAQAGARLPLLQGVRLSDRTALLFSPLDLSVSANGHHAPQLRGYTTESAQRILRNVVLYCLARRAAGG